MRATLLWIAALTATVAAEPLKIPLYRRTDDGVVRADAKQLDNGVLGGTILIGTPPQEFTVAFDTTTGYSWVRGSRCKSENCLDRCTYYARRSETVVSTGKKLKVKYGSACVETTVFLDTVEFAGISVPNMPFGNAYRMTGFDHGFDGYFGLGRSVNFNQTTVYTGAAALTRRDLPPSAFVPNAYQSGSGLQSAQFGIFTTYTEDNGFGVDGTADPNQPSAIAPLPTTATTTAATTTTGATQTPVEQPSGQPVQPIQPVQPVEPSPATPTEVTSGGFGFFKREAEQEASSFGFFKRHNKKPAGYLVLGGIDEDAIEGDMVYIPLAENGGSSNYDVPIPLVRFETELIFEQDKNAVATISTSQNYITMPADQADQFHAKFGGKFLAESGTYKVKCSKIKDLPRLKIYLGDYIFELAPQYWTRVIDADTDCCATRISKGTSSRDWILGTSFTNNFYTSFDPVEEKVGLALKKGQNNNGLKIYTRK